jgi:hypothetical protein
MPEKYLPAFRPRPTPRTGKIRAALCLKQYNMVDLLFFYPNLRAWEKGL